MNDTARAADEKSLGELFGDLTRETATLVRQEIALARAEMGHKLTEVGRNIGFLCAGGAVLYAGLLATVGAAVLGLAQTGLPLWAAALIVGAVVAGVGCSLVWAALNALKHLDLVPRETIDALKEDRYDSGAIRRRATG